MKDCGDAGVDFGAGAGEVLGDYGAGPNHTLPTSRASRFTGGLSVFTFLRIRTWLSIEDEAGAAVLAEDAEWFGRLEGLEGRPTEMKAGDWRKLRSDFRKRLAGRRR